jgi:16S rRNA G1207 methylase RsmC
MTEVKGILDTWHKPEPVEDTAEQLNGLPLFEAIASNPPFQA